MARYNISRRRSNKRTARSRGKPVKFARRRKRGLLNGAKVYKFSRYASGKLSIPLSQTTEVSQTFASRFNDIQNYTEFTTLFDQYMITGVAYYIHLVTNPDNSAGQTTQTGYTTTYPVLWSVIDYDDDSNLPLSGMREKQGVKRTVMKPNKMIKRYVPFPRVSQEIYNSGVTTAYSMAPPLWVDCNSPAAPHYGIKFCVDAEAQTTQTYNIQIERKYYFKLKGVQ